MLKTLKVKLNTRADRSYSIVIGRGILKNAGKTIKDLGIGNDIFLITDSNVNRLYGKQALLSFRRGGFKETGGCVILAGEKSKSLASFQKIQDALYNFDRRGDRQIVVATLGGGVPGDLGGFIAGTYKRGVSFIQMPTTLLGFVDCGLGGKTAVNFRKAKNSIGIFWQPRLVYMDIDTLRSLPLREIQSGLAETLKYGIISDPSLFDYLEFNSDKLLALDMAVYEKVIPICVKIKADITSADERDEKDIRIMLNFGHTAGHAIEAATNYKKYTHGEAIALGMLIAGEISKELGLFQDADLFRLENLIENLGLPVKLSGCKVSSVLEAMKHDKKFKSGVNRFILPVKIGACKVVNNIPEKVIAKAIKSRMV